MNLRRDVRSFSAIALTAVAVLACAGMAFQRPALVRLRARTQELRTPSAASPSVPWHSSASPSETHGTALAPTSLTPPERVELMELRSRVTDLRARQRSLAGATNEIAALQARLSQMSNYAGGRVPEGYVRRASARNLGQATPEAAVETFFWALEHRDAAAFLDLIPPDQRTIMERALTERGSDAFFQEVPAMPGYRLASRREVNPDEVVVELQIGPQKPWKLTLRRQDGVWHVHN